MEQKDYKLEIVKTLKNEMAHARGIAVKLGTNHMMIVRKTRELMEENVIDVKMEGRNKSYFLKDSVEARMYLQMSENYRLINLLKKYPGLRVLVNMLQKDKRIKMAVIFGSYAKGIPKKNSDIDVFIETSDIELKKKYSRMDSKYGIKIGKLSKGDLLSEEIFKNHVIIKGVEKFYERAFA